MKSWISPGKNFKHIKLHGEMISAGEYDTADVDIRPYEAVTLKDMHGEELHFRLLLVPKRLDDAYMLKEEVTFYLLRHKNKKGQLIGALYAIEKGNDKLYFPDHAWKAIKTVAQAGSRRGILLAIPVLFALVAPLGAFIAFMIMFLLFSPLGSFISTTGGLAAAAFWVYALLFPIIKTRKYVNFEEMESIIHANGFKPMALSSATGKY